jgi:hypothetical protein
VELHIEPEPSPEERAAIEAAIGRDPGRGEVTAAEWARAEADEDPPATRAG